MGITQVVLPALDIPNPYELQKENIELKADLKKIGIYKEWKQDPFKGAHHIGHGKVMMDEETAETLFRDRNKLNSKNQRMEKLERENDELKFIILTLKEDIAKLKEAKKVIVHH